MPSLFGKNYSRADLLKRIGSIEQIAAVRKIALLDGKAAGIEAFDFNTGSGLSFTVLPSRGMDIAAAHYNGASLNWRSSVGETAPQFFDPAGIGWLRSFGGGLLTTCGLTYLGAPCHDNGEDLGIHGRISNIPATNANYDIDWKGNNATLWASGKVRETRVFGENILLSRKISAPLGQSRILIEDEIKNEGYERTPFMLLYHFNLGFPLLDHNARLIAPSKQTILREGKKQVPAARWQQFPPPQRGFQEEVFYHVLKPDRNGFVTILLTNEKFANNKGLALYLRYRQRELPRFVQWKMAGEGTYVLGLEPANCWVEGRAEERRRKSLKFLRPGQSQKTLLELGILDSNDEIKKIKKLNNI
jgi:hypothetical protein